MTEEDARREGFKNLEEFKEAWMGIYKSWDDRLRVCMGDRVRVSKRKL